jgi:hypothetical protein
LVRVQPDPPHSVRCGTGGVAQLGERLLCKQEVIGSIPFTSTSLLNPNESAWRAFPFGFARAGESHVAVSIFNNSEEAKRFNPAPGDEPGEG